MNVSNFTYESFEGSGNHDPVFFEDLNALGKKPETKKSEKVQEVIEAPKPVAMTFTQEELDLAKALAKEEGRREGAEEAANKHQQDKARLEAEEQQKVSGLLEKINFELFELMRITKQSEEGFKNELSHVAFAIAKKVCSKVAAEYLEQEIRSMVSEVLAGFNSDEKLKIYLNPKNAAHLNDKFTHTELNIDESMEEGDFRVEWKSGFAERSTRKILVEIEKICSLHSKIEETEIEHQAQDQETSSGN